VDGNVLLGPTAEDTEDLSYYGVAQHNLDYLYEEAMKIWPHVRRADYIRTYSGILPKWIDENGKIGDFRIEILDDTAPRAVNLIGIESPGLTASVAIARHVISMMQEREEFAADPSFDPVRPHVPRFADLSPDEQARRVAADPDEGELICRCEKVTKAEVLRAIRNPLGCAAMASVKYRTRSMMGRCQGGYCQMRVARLLEEEKGLRPEELVYMRRDGHPFFGRVRGDAEGGAL
jgi:glycerol-3-phosphate dehydrogenase